MGRFNWARAVEVLEKDRSSMGVSEVVFCCTSIADNDQLLQADKDFDQGHLWMHARLTNKGAGPAWPIQGLDKQLQKMSVADVAHISQMPAAAIWPRLVQFSGVQITQPILQACGHALFGRGAVIPHDMITFTVQGQSDIFNMWNRNKDEGVRCTDPMYVCIVKYQSNGKVTSYGVRPAVGLANGQSPREVTILNRDRYTPPEIVHSYFIGTVISQQRIRYIRRDRLESLFHVEGSAHPQTIGLQLISINTRM
jgi:hypothetical protein